MATRDCGDCRKWLYDINDGTIRRDSLGNLQPRPHHVPPPCDQRGAKPCPRGHWTDPSGFDPDTLWIYQQVKECEVTGDWPKEDPLFRSYAKTIRLAEETVKRSKEQADRNLQVELAKMIEERTRARR